MFLDEARIASKVHHRNVVPVLDVVTIGDEVVLVQEYVHGAPLSLLLRDSCASADARADPGRGVDRVPGARRPARRARDRRRDGHAAQHRPSRRVAAEHHGRDRRHRAPARFRRREGGDEPRTSRARARSRASSATRRPSRSAARRPARATSTRSAIVLWELLVGHRMHGNAQGEAAADRRDHGRRAADDHRRAR